MHMPTRRDWSQGCAEVHLEVMRRAPQGDLPRLARSYDWNAHPGPVLGWIMAQRRIDLGTALSVFLCGGPERFNYLPKRDVPSDHKAAARLLDNICLRINSGFYLPGDDFALADKPRLENWLVAQKADRDEGTSGRWVLDETIVTSVMATGQIAGQGGSEAPSTGATGHDAARRGWTLAAIAPLMRWRTRHTG